jgi:hypothetical protein
LLGRRDGCRRHGRPFGGIALQHVLRCPDGQCQRGQHGACLYGDRSEATRGWLRGEQRARGRLGRNGTEALEQLLAYALQARIVW